MGALPSSVSESGATASRMPRWVAPDLSSTRTCLPGTGRGASSQLAEQVSAAKRAKQMDFMQGQYEPVRFAVVP